ncbi:MAG: ATP-binding protein [Rhodoferax sp.]
MHKRIALRSFLIGALLLVLLPIVAASGWFFFRSAQGASAEFAQQMADEVSGRVRDKIVAFFDAPQRVVTFNVEQARAGYLRQREPEELMRQFLLQIRQQPQLCFVSMGLTDGQYVAGSRPPLGQDRDLRMLRSRIADGRSMEVFRVDADNRRGPLISRSEIHFDARTRPWYQAAIARGGMSWYAPYRYLINDVQGAYAAMGMGVSAPVFDAGGALVGVTTADVALSQVDEFLRSVVSESGGLAFVADAAGELLATSTPEPSFRIETDKKDYRVKTADSANPVLRAIGRQLARPNRAGASNHFIEVDATRYLVRLWSQALANGPVLTVGVILPESQFDKPLRGVLGNIVYLTLAVMLAAVLFAVYVANRVVRPLALLSGWAERLTSGDWQAVAPASSSIRELLALSDAMGYMASHLKQHAQQLEQDVAERTGDLKNAMDAIEQTLTEQRHFIGMLSHEVRSPLAVINTAAQLLSFRLKNDPAQLAVVERIRRGAARLSYFFDNCLTQDRIDSSDFALEPAPIDAASMLAWVVDNGAQLSAEHPLDTAFASDLGTLQGDEVLLRIALMNLLSNAFMYSPPGSAVCLRAWREAAQCCFAVEDLGGGIAPQERALVFQKYRRGRAAQGQPGAGLGLALVQRIASLHGGAVRVEDRLPVGTRVLLSIAVLATEPAQP